MVEKRVLFTEDRCKGCELCLDACPQKIIFMAEHMNGKGFHPAAVTDQERCTGCALCARMCPDLVITVYRPERPTKAVS
ncbi:MAG: 4Fe-4S binding protein [bacterium]|nr:4Fe-4S binding protein [bacterium]